MFHVAEHPENKIIPVIPYGYSVVTLIRQKNAACRVIEKPCDAICL